MAERAAARYNVVLAGFDSAFRVGLSEEPGAPRTQRRVLNSAYAIADAFLAGERDHVGDALQAARDGAFTLTSTQLGSAAAMSDAVAKHVTLIGTDLETALRSQVQRDVAGVLAGLRGVSLRASLIAAGQAIPRSRALQIAREDAQLTFAHTDRGNKRWGAAKYVRTLWRHAMVLGWNETSLLLMAEHGVGTATIEHPDADHAWNGQRISLSETGTLPVWGDVVDEVFHPNSECWLSPASGES